MKKIKSTANLMILSMILSMANLCATNALATPSDAPTAEEAMLANVIALTGDKNLSASLAQQKLAGVYVEYDQTAPRAGRTDRFESALVQMNIISQKQISELDQQLRQSAGTLGSIEMSSEEVQKDAVRQELQKITNTMDGAQYSGSAYAKCLIIPETVGLGMLTASFFIKPPAGGLQYQVFFEVFGILIAMGGLIGC